MIVFGVLTFEEAVSAIDFNTIALLLGMMVLVSVLQLAGFFTMLAVKSVTYAGSPGKLLWIVVGATALFSAFLVNDAVVLFFTPIILQTCRLLKLRAVPYLVAEAMAANIGSTATIVGNPQNMLIGIKSGISFGNFFLYLAPVAVVSTLILIGIIYLFYRREFNRPFAVGIDTLPRTGFYDVAAIKRAIPVVGVTLVMFFLSSFLTFPIPVVALCGAALVMLTCKYRPSKVIRGVDWVLLLFFAGLFILIEGAHKAGLFNLVLGYVSITPDLSGVLSVSAFSVIVSQIVSNVPLTMLAIPVLENVPGDVLWIALASAATLGGNLTVIGAVANIIVAEGAARENVNLPFLEFLKVGSVVTIATVGVGVMIIALEMALGILR
jgi:Na+/H+ antiporter NhaD/arsenite permease-like protein